MDAKKVSLYPFQFRVLKCLFNHPYFIKQLNNDSKQQHSPNAVRHLRTIGINIVSTFKDNPDVTAVTRRQIVEYSIHPESREFAAQVLFHHRNV